LLDLSEEFASYQGIPAGRPVCSRPVSILQALTLGAVQGLTEFIPISSSGHLVLIPQVLDWNRPGLAFDVLLHAASLVALLAFFRHDLMELARGVVRRDRRSINLAVLLAVGTIPAALAGLLLGSYFEGSFEDAPAAAIQLGITALILVAAEVLLSRQARARHRLRRMDELNALDALAVGAAQAIAIWPGISRSGATIATGLALRVQRDDAARFAFLLAIPALAGAALVELPELGDIGLDPGAAIAGFISSLVFSYVAIAGLIRYLQRRTLYPFAVYCLVAAVVFYFLVS
jgi:undecaprenyl-diphosphatase